MITIQTIPTRPRIGADPRRDRGSLSVVVVLVSCAVAMVVIAAIMAVAPILIERQRAQSAADAAALAGVVGGRPAAVKLAAANGGTLLEWVDDGDQVTVVVAVGGQRARARATDRP